MFERIPRLTPASLPTPSWWSARWRATDALVVLVALSATACVIAALAAPMATTAAGLVGHGWRWTEGDQGKQDRK